MNEYLFCGLMLLSFVLFTVGLYALSEAIRIHKHNKAREEYERACKHNQHFVNKVKLIGEHIDWIECVKENENGNF